MPPTQGAAPDRIQVVALEAQTVYELDMVRRQSAAVPEGHFFLVAYRQGGLVGLDAEPRNCVKGESLRAKPPEAPPKTHHGLVVQLELPDSETDVSELSLSVQPVVPRRELRLVPPAAVVWMGPQGTALFPRLEAAEELEVSLKHPKLRSLRREFSALGGGLTTLANVDPRRRPALTIPVDYKPARKHSTQKIVGYFCGPRELTGRTDIENFANCQRLATDFQLRSGLHQYVFPDLDDGQYLFNAIVDDEVVYGLSNWFTPFLDTSAADFGEIPVQPLRELHIYGHILEGEEPVPGYVRVAFTSYSAPDLLAPTDDELLYHLYYFGKYARYDYLLEQLPGAAKKRKEEVRGLFYGVRFNACGNDGTCKAYLSSAALAGEGRFDFQLGEDSGVAVRVIDADTQQPIVGAIVGTTPGEDEQAFQFYDGKLRFRERAKGPWGGWVFTGEDGIARVRLPAGEQGVTVGKPGSYEPPEGKYLAVKVPDGGWAEREVELAKVEPSESEARFVFSDGRPVARAFLSVFDANGNRRVDSCSTLTNLGGGARFRDGCLEGATVALLHSTATISLFSGSELANGGEIEVSPAPSNPAKLRILDDEGQPKPGIFFHFRYGRIVLQPLDFAISHGAGQGPILVGPSDSDGIITLRGIDLSPAAAPSILPVGDKRGRLISLAALGPGDKLDVEVSD